jgi:hypothetical protein
MFWPSRRVEQLRATGFRPPFCPWSECAQHELSDPEAFRYNRAGYYKRKCDQRRIPRFCCKTCGRTFSQQSFACSYYLKRPELLTIVAAGLNAGSAHRQIARTVGCAPSTVTRLSAHLGRHSVLLHFLAFASIGAIQEPVVLDHFESFVHSQHHPVGLCTPVGHHSWFCYGLDPAPHRRGGRLSPAQRRAAPRRAPPRGSVVGSFRRTLDLLQAKIAKKLVLISDGHPAYRRGLADHPAARRIEHRIYRNPPRGPKGSPRSLVARQRDQAMFPVDLLHALWRHSCAHHRRETIAFARRVYAVMERGFLMLVWRNFVKGVSERRPDPTTPAMRLELTDRPWNWQRVLAQRLFPTRMAAPGAWKTTYQRDWKLPGIGIHTRHGLRNAY